MFQYLQDSVTHISFSSILENNIGILSLNNTFSEIKIIAWRSKHGKTETD